MRGAWCDELIDDQLRLGTASESSRSNAALPLAPTIRFTGCPSLNRIRVGMETTWKLCAVSGLASTSSFSLRSLAISSRTGATILQGPHHVAQKSTSTGLLLDNTSEENDASETSIVAPAFSASVIVVLQSMCRYCLEIRWRRLVRRRWTLRGRRASVRRRWLLSSRCSRR